MSPWAASNLAYQDSATISDDENAKTFREPVSRGRASSMWWFPTTARRRTMRASTVTGKMALVQRGGGMYYEQKERSAYAHGAIAMLVYNNVPGMLYMSITDWKMPCAFISQEAGEYLKAAADQDPVRGLRPTTWWSLPPMVWPISPAGAPPPS
ncbi:MAG: PA domain-containing protein [Dysosmobacter sp.]